MKKIIISIVLVALLCAVMSLAGCGDNGTTTGTTTSTTTAGDTNQTTTKPGTTNGSTTTIVPDDVEPLEGAELFEFSKYGYHIYYPQGFEIINNEGNMVEFMNDAGVDFTVLVLENKYDSLTKLLNSELEETEEIVKQGSNYALTCYADNGRVSFTYYYLGKDFVRCELSYVDAQKDAMRGAEEYIMVEAHSHSH